MRIKPVKMTDTRALALIMSSWIRETPWMPKLHTEQEDLRFIRHLIDKKEVTCFRNLMGPYAFMARDGGVIHALYVDRRFRGRGLGKRMLDRVKAIESRIELWCFQANDRARAFYAREGFEEVEFTDGAGNDEKLPDVRLVWERGDE